MGRIANAIRAATAELRGQGTNTFWGRLHELVGLGSTASGQRVGPDSAMKYAAFYAAVDRISCDIAKLPLKLMHRKPNGDRDAARQHLLYQLLHDGPNEEQTSFIFRQSIMSDALRWGNGYAEILRTGGGSVAGLAYICADTMHVDRIRGQLMYTQATVDGGQQNFRPDQILHIRTIGDGILGWSPVRLFREGIGLGLAAENAGAAFFGNGMRPGAVLEHPTRLSDEAASRLRKSVEDQAGGSGKQGRVLLAEEGMKYIPLSISPTDAQYIETRVHQVRDIARIFRIPPHKLSDLADATFSNVEEMNKEYVDDCLGPWLVQWEQEIARKLLLPQERGAGYYAHFDVNALLRGKAVERAEFYAKLFHIGAVSVNEIRQKEDLNGIGASGDQHFVPVNLRPADSEYQPTAANPPNVPAVNGERFVDAAHVRVLRDVCERICKMRTSGGPKSERERSMIRPAIAAALASVGLESHADAMVGRALECSTARSMVEQVVDRANKQSEWERAMSPSDRATYLAIYGGTEHAD